MAENNGTLTLEEKDIITLVDEKIGQDAEFQTELETLSDEEKATKISEKKAELIKQEYATIAEKAKKDAELANNYKIRAEKAEKANAIPPKNNSNDPQLSEELKLIARGLSDEAIEQAKVIAKGKGISLPEAIKDPLFLIFKKDLEETEKRENAKLGASKGSGETEQEIKGTESGAPRDEHIKAFNKALGKK
jgi:hypothetical protein